MKKNIFVIIFLVTLLFILLCFTTYVMAEQKESFFEGKNLIITTPGSPGGGMDTYSRLIGKVLAKELKANFLVQNAATMYQAIVQFKNAKPNGLTITTFTMPGLIIAQLLGTEGIGTFDLREITYIGRIESEPSVFYVGQKSGITSYQDIVSANKEIKMGFAALSNDDYFFSKIETDLLGIKMKPIAGFQGGGGVNLSVIKGEIDGSQSSYSSARTLINNKEVIPIFVLASERLPELPDVPTILELVSDEKKDLVLKIIKLAELGRCSLAVSKEVPLDRVEELRRAFFVAINSKELLDEAAKLKRPINPMEGEKLQEMVQFIFNSSDLIKIVETLK